jgi:hypothetical protein
MALKILINKKGFLGKSTALCHLRCEALKNPTSGKCYDCKQMPLKNSQFKLEKQYFSNKKQQYQFLKNKNQANLQSISLL